MLIGGKSKTVGHAGHVVNNQVRPVHPLVAPAVHRASVDRYVISRQLVCKPTLQVSVAIYSRFELLPSASQKWPVVIQNTADDSIARKFRGLGFGRLVNSSTSNIGLAPVPWTVLLARQAHLGGSVLELRG